MRPRMKKASEMPATEALAGQQFTISCSSGGSQSHEPQSQLGQVVVVVVVVVKAQAKRSNHLQSCGLDHTAYSAAQDHREAEEGPTCMAHYYLKRKLVSNRANDDATPITSILYLDSETA